MWVGVCVYDNSDMQALRSRYTTKLIPMDHILQIYSYILGEYPSM